MFKALAILRAAGGRLFPYDHDIDILVSKSWHMGCRFASTLTRFKPNRTFFAPPKTPYNEGLPKYLSTRKKSDGLDTIS